MIFTDIIFGLVAGIYCCLVYSFHVTNIDIRRLGSYSIFHVHVANQFHSIRKCSMTQFFALFVLYCLTRPEIVNFIGIADTGLTFMRLLRMLLMYIYIFSPGMFIILSFICYLFLASFITRPLFWNSWLHNCTSFISCSIHWNEDWKV